MKRAQCRLILLNLIAVELHKYALCGRDVSDVANAAGEDLLMKIGFLRLCLFSRAMIKICR